MVINTQCALDLKCGEFSSNTDAGLITNNFPDTVNVGVEWFTPGSIALDFNRKDINIFGGASFRTGIACGVIRVFLFDKWFVLPVISVWELDRSGRRFVRCSYNVCPYESQTYFPSPSRQNFGSFSRFAILNRKHGKKPKTEASDAQAPARSATPRPSGERR